MIYLLMALAFALGSGVNSAPLAIAGLVASGFLLLRLIGRAKRLMMNAIMLLGLLGFFFYKTTGSELKSLNQFRMPTSVNSLIPSIVPNPK